jgi:GTP-binding protein
MIPVIALVGRPNVGKSTLFNVLTRSRDALVVDLPGVTRDRLYGEIHYHDHKAIVIDTGGLGDDTSGINGPMEQQTLQAIDEADHVLFLVDARAGLSAGDQEIARLLRQRSKPTFLVVNKIDGVDETIALSDFYQLGLGEPIGIAASHRRGVQQMLDKVIGPLVADQTTEEVSHQDMGIKIALIGRPNVGKSTLTNRMLGEERVVVFDQPGTTRDSIYLPLERQGQRYTLIDTAGVRRKGKVQETIEKFSVVKTLQAIEDAHVVVAVLDAQEGITEQDLHVLGFALNAGRAMVLAINKWDGLPDEQREYIKTSIERRLVFVADYVDIHFISALHGTGVGNLYKSIQVAYAAAQKKLSTTQVTKVLQQAIMDHSPPMVNGRRIKLRYAHVGGHNPPIIVIHGNQTERLPESYKKYLEGVFRKTFKLHGTTIKIEVKSTDNPFSKRPNPLNDHEVMRARRLARNAAKYQASKGE